MIDAIQKAREALKPFAERASNYDTTAYQDFELAVNNSITVGDLRCAREALAALDAAERTPEAGGVTQFAWLIEAPGQYYLCARELVGYGFCWSQDHNTALRFFSQEQADLAMMAIRALTPTLFEFAKTLGDARAVEHGWLVSPHPAPEPVREPIPLADPILIALSDGRFIASKPFGPFNVAEPIPPAEGEYDGLVKRLRELASPPYDSAVFGGPMTRAATAIEFLQDQVRKQEGERDALVLSTGEHVMVRGEYLARAQAAELALATARERADWLYGIVEESAPHRLTEDAMPVVEGLKEKADV